MNYNEISNEEFLAKKAEAMQNEPLTKKVRLNKIELTDNSFSDGTVKVEGRSMAASPQFFNKLSGILNISDAMKRDLTDGESEKKAGLFPKMVETMKLIKTSKDGGGNIVIIGNPSTGELTGLTNKDYSRIPNKDLFDLTEKLVDKYPMLKPISISVEDGGMNMGIRLLGNADHQFKPVGGPRGGGGSLTAPEDETFRFGFTLNNGTATSLGDFAYRLVCTNGMMGMKDKENFQLKGLSADAIRKMFEHIAACEKRGFIPEMFTDNLKTASTVASLRELEKVYGGVVSNLAIDDDQLRDHVKRELAHKFFQGYVRTNVKLAQRDINPHDLSNKQKAFIGTGQSIWDVVNNLTWLGSHDSGYQWKNQSLLMKMGGKEFYTEHDLQYADLMKL